MLPVLWVGVRWQQTQCLLEILAPLDIVVIHLLEENTRSETHFWMTTHGAREGRGRRSCLFRRAFVHACVLSLRSRTGVSPSWRSANLTTEGGV